MWHWTEWKSKTWHYHKQKHTYMLHHGKLVLLSCCVLPCGWMYNIFNTPGHHPLQPTSQRLECGLKHTASENISTEHDEQPTSWILWSQIIPVENIRHHDPLAQGWKVKNMFSDTCQWKYQQCATHFLKVGRKWSFTHLQSFHFSSNAPAAPPCWVSSPAVTRSPTAVLAKLPPDPIGRGHQATPWPLALASSDHQGRGTSFLDSRTSTWKLWSDK